MSTVRSVRGVSPAVSFVVLALLTTTSLLKAADFRPGTHKVEAYDSATAARLEAAGGKVVADYGSYQVYSVETVDVELLAASKIELRDEFNLVRLNAAVLDTTRAETKTLRKAVGSFTGKRMHLVQFVGAVQPAWAEQLEGLGVQIVAYVPFNAYLVYGDATSLSRVQQFASTASHVQWDGAYLNDYKIHPTARTKDANGNPRQIGADMFAVCEDCGMEDRDAMVARGREAIIGLFEGDIRPLQIHEDVGHG